MLETSLQPIHRIQNQHIRTSCTSWPTKGAPPKAWNEKPQILTPLGFEYRNPNLNTSWYRNSDCNTNLIL